MTLKCTKHLLILASTIIGCISISEFDSLVDSPTGISSFVGRPSSSATAIKFFAITAEIKENN